MPPSLTLIFAAQLPLKTLPILPHHFQFLFTRIFHALVFIFQEILEVTYSAIYFVPNTLRSHLLQLPLDFFHIVVCNFAFSSSEILLLHLQDFIYSLIHTLSFFSSHLIESFLDVHAPKQALIYINTLPSSLGCSSKSFSSSPKRGRFGLSLSTLQIFSYKSFQRSGSLGTTVGRSAVRSRPFLTPLRLLNIYYKAPIRWLKPYMMGLVECPFDWGLTKIREVNPQWFWSLYLIIMMPDVGSERVHTTWYNPDSLPCKVVGPSSKCFCDHNFKTHNSKKGPQVPCTTPSCKCKDYSYLPVHGSQDLKCLCKHSYTLHDPNKRTCTSCPCKLFNTTWSCTCGAKYADHTTISEGQSAKQAKGETMHPQHGGVVSYSSMLSASERFTNEGKKMKVETDLKREPGLHGGEVSAWELFNTPLR